MSGNAEEIDDLYERNARLEQRNRELVKEVMEKSADLSEAREERDRVKLEVQLHSEQTGHNMCWLTDLRLWRAVLGDHIVAYPHSTVPPKSEFVGVGCEAYFASRFKAAPNPFTRPPYRTVEELVGLIDEPNRSACWRILDENRRLFQTVQGSTNNHQAWPGGYWDHVSEVMNIAAFLYPRMNFLRPLPFSLSDALLVVFLHDVEKPWKYEIGPDGQLQHREGLRTKEDAHGFRGQKLAQYSFALTPEQENAMRYVEGEFDDYTNRRRVMGPLAAFCHLCDVTSARIWYDHPQVKDDPWPDACRPRE